MISSSVKPADAQYALDLCARIATNTDVPGTITRLFLSPATRGVHALLLAEMDARGMAVRVDSAGNLRGVYPAAEQTPAAPILLMGSHIDTVPDAGAYDGILGVALPLALIRSLQGKRFTFAIEVIAFSEEEGIRFRLPFLGSRALTGTIGAEELARTDPDGVTVGQALLDFGSNPATLRDASITPNTFAFLECHLEQGPVLESLDLPLGIVETIIGQSRYELTFSGQANHAGTTPMLLRHDALAAAAAFIVAAEAHARATDGLVATVGVIHAAPGAPNIVPGLVTCSLDVRHAQDDLRLANVEKLLAEASRAGAARGVQMTSRATSVQASVAMDGRLIECLTSAARSTGHTALRMNSGAGHDAAIIAGRVPAAMLFLRTPGGLSHHPDESVSLPDVQAAIEVGLAFLRSLAPPSR